MVHDIVSDVGGNHCRVLLVGGDDMDREEIWMGREVNYKGKKVPHKVFSPRADLALSRVWWAQSEFRETCKECGFKVRGPNHKAGKHHKLRHPKIRRQD